MDRFLNLAPIEFGRVVGLYIATLFVVWQGDQFHRLPNSPYDAHPGSAAAW